MTIETEQGDIEVAVTKFLPASWLDEVVPVPQRDIDAFIHRAEGGTWFLMPVDADDDDDDFYREALEPGQIVEFSAYEDYGDWTIRINDDRSIDAGGIPDKATHFRLDDDNDTLAYSLIELAANGDGSPLPAGEHQVSAWYWSDASYSFRFVVDADGTARFERCAGTN